MTISLLNCGECTTTHSSRHSPGDHALKNSIDLLIHRRERGESGRRVREILRRRRRIGSRQRIAQLIQRALLDGLLALDVGARRRVTWRTPKLAQHAKARLQRARALRPEAARRAEARDEDDALARHDRLGGVRHGAAKDQCRPNCRRDQIRRRRIVTPAAAGPRVLDRPEGGAAASVARLLREVDEACDGLLVLVRREAAARIVYVDRRLAHRPRKARVAEARRRRGGWKYRAARGAEAAARRTMRCSRRRRARPPSSARCRQCISSRAQCGRPVRRPSRATRTRPPSRAIRPPASCARQRPRPRASLRRPPPPD